MCRLAAYLGPARPLSEIVIEPRHSLIAQSQDSQQAKVSVQGDGFGIAWYGLGPEPGLYKDILPAWSDRNLVNLCQHIRAPLFLAHVRASTEGETARANCHPFTHGNWSFMHNGQTGSFTALRRPLEASLPDDLYAMRQGSTDSELMFLLLLSAGLENDPAQACRTVIAQMTDTARSVGVTAFLRQTCVFSDGHSLFCFRYASDGRCPTLYVSRTFAGGGLIVASEPLDGRSDQWAEITPNQLVRLDATDQTSFDLLAA